jgi:hypothetical protein
MHSKLLKILIDLLYFWYLYSPIQVTGPTHCIHEPWIHAVMLSRYRFQCGLQQCSWKNPCSLFLAFLIEVLPYVSAAESWLSCSWFSPSPKISLKILNQTFPWPFSYFRPCGQATLPHLISWSPIPNLDWFLSPPHPTQSLIHSSIHLRDIYWLSTKSIRVAWINNCRI